MDGSPVRKSAGDTGRSPCRRGASLRPVAVAAAGGQDAGGGPARGRPCGRRSACSPIGALGLARAYRGTLRFYQGGENKKAGRRAPRARRAEQPPRQEDPGRTVAAGAFPRKPPPWPWPASARCRAPGGEDGPGHERLIFASSARAVLLQRARRTAGRAPGRLWPAPRSPWPSSG